MRPTRRPAALAGLLALAACTVTLVARYDETFDRAATSLQREMDTHLTRLLAVSPASDSAAYPASAPFYSAYQVDLRSLLVRSRSLPHNELTAQQVELLVGSVEDLRSLHERRGRLDTAFVRQSRDLLNQGWQSILALELAKRR